MDLTAQQQEVVDFVSEGHNLVLLGAAGTGKSFVIEKIRERVETMGKNCAITATTGIACSVYSSTCNAMTVHRWSGIGDGRYSPKEFQRVVKNNVKYQEVVSRIHSTDVLVVDECSMMSKRLLDSLNEVCSIKNPALYFGGIQVILVGDMRQLPPVPCARYGEDGSYCFESPVFSNAFPHRLKLDQVVRQNETALIQAVHELSVGEASQETLSLLKDLGRPLNGDIVKLFSTNDLVDDYNRDEIVKFPGELYEFAASDHGDKHHIKDIKASRNLWIKKGMPVLLIRNLSDKLVNGLRGTVIDIIERNILVDFPTITEKILIETVKFEVFDPRLNAVVAVREQYPLKPGFALTIHKSQGMSLEKVDVDCKEIFSPGQLGVAIGRAKSLEGLRVVNFSTKCCKKQPEKVIQFLEQDNSADIGQDRSCCVSKVRSQENSQATFTVEEIMQLDTLQNKDDDIGPAGEELDDDFNNVLLNLDDFENNETIFPHDFDLSALCEKLRSKTVLTPMQYENNDILSRMSLSKLEVFTKHEYSKLSKLLDECPCSDSGQISSKDLGTFMSKVHQHANSLEFRICCLKLFESEGHYSAAHQSICFNISMEIRKYLLAEKAKEVQMVESQLPLRTMTDAARARVRYVGGYCIAKVRHKYITKKANHRFSSKQSDTDIYEEAKCALDILNCLKVDEQSILASTDEPESLIDISRRQNLNRGLTNITDRLFAYFLHLTEKCLNYFVDENMNRLGADMFKVCQKETMSCVSLYEEFVKCCTVQQEQQTSHRSDESLEGIMHHACLQVSQIEEIYDAVVKKYLMVMFNQFRKDALDSFKVEKKMAHRKQVRVSTTVKGKENTLSKRMSSNLQPPSTSASTSCEPQPSTSASTSCEPQPSTSASTYSEPQLSPRTLQHSIQSGSDEESEICDVCRSYSKDAEWIQCDMCNAWLHRSCAGLKHHLRWKKFQRKGATFICKNCE